MTRTYGLEAGLLLGLAVVALVIRLPYLQLIPAYTDEIFDFERGFFIAQGKLFPLTNYATYMGSLWNWLIAMAFWFTQNDLNAPRTLVLTFGVLSVLATYLLGRAWGGQVGGLLAGGLLSTAASHIVVVSHVGWSNSVTPLFTTLAVWALDQAVRCKYKSQTMLLISGLSWGLAVHTHPTAAALLPAAGIFLLWRGKHLCWTRWPYLAAGLFIVVNVNMIIYNLNTDFDSLTAARRMQAHYTGGETLTLPIYLARTGAWTALLMNHLGGAAGWPQYATEVLLDVGLWPATVLAIVGALYVWRLGNPLPILLPISLVLALSLFTSTGYDVLDIHYLAPLLPVLYAAIGALLHPLSKVVGLQSYGIQNMWKLLSLRLAVLGVGVFLLLHPLLYLQAHYSQVLQLDWTNEPLFRTIQAVETNRRSDEPVIVDRKLEEGRSLWGGGTRGQAIRLALYLRGIPYCLVNLEANELLDPDHPCRQGLVILAARQPEANELIARELNLRGLDGSPAKLQLDASGSVPGATSTHPTSLLVLREG